MIPRPPLPPAVAEALAMVADVCRVCLDPWWIIGSAAVALHGADPVDVADIDVLTSEADAERVLDAAGCLAAPGQPDTLFRSALFGVWHAPPLTVEFMAGLEVREEAGWTRVAPVTRLRCDMAGGTVFVPARSELIALLDRFGRPKDRVRAALLA